ncbi:uncharacterized protein FIESC28_07404 [Fusarium coffeatum]|uniref:Uncharacterized protein n=1 Tax=Fusarium coffeatum TaxID=231269 RepID=A0A366RDJ6_9HYPO|nr:uncharacterized protein FIESC28_07404 [Fusarium coffeatum]RBR15224.1 hypothetical protein FIESC28_07404 [Fusarium coffeatum]
MWEEAVSSRGPAPNANFDPSDRVRRRDWIERKLDHDFHWNELQWQLTREKTELQACIRLHKLGFEKVGAAFFDYTVDWGTWEEYLKLRSLDKYEFCWPWGKIMRPSDKDERQGISQAYKAWLEAEVHSASNPKDPEDPKGVKPEAKPATSQATGKPPKPAPKQGGPSNPRGPKPPKPGQEQGGSSVAPRVPPKPVSSPRATSSGAVRKPTAQPAAAPQVAESSAAALARARAEKKPMKVPPHLAHKFGDNANSKAEPTRDEAHEAALAAARLAANREKVGEITSAFKGFALEDKIEQEAMDKAKKEEEAKWKDLEDKSHYRFLARLASLHEKPPLRQAYRPAFKVGRIPPPCPDLKLRQQIWDIVEFPSPTGPCLGPFELALPPWVDFFDLLLGKEGKLFGRISEFTPRDVAIAWTKNEDGLPKSLVVGPHPDLGHSATSGPLRKAVCEVWFQVVSWATEAYLGRPHPLLHYLKCHETLFEKKDIVLSSKTMDSLFEVWNTVSNPDYDFFAISMTRKDNLIRWVPEIHAILKVRGDKVELALQDWVVEGQQDEKSVRERTDAVMDTWARYSPVRAYFWDRAVNLALSRGQLPLHG